MNKYKIGDKIIYNNTEGEIVKIFNFDNKEPIFHIKTYQDAKHYKVTASCFEKVDDIINSSKVKINKKEFLQKLISVSESGNIITELKNKKLHMIEDLSLTSVMAGFLITENLFNDKEEVEINRKILIDLINKYVEEYININQNKIIKDPMDIVIMTFVSTTITKMLYEFVDCIFGAKND